MNKSELVDAMAKDTGLVRPLKTQYNINFYLGKAYKHSNGILRLDPDVIICPDKMHH